MFLCDGVRPDTNSEFFEEIWLYGGVFIGLAHLDPAL